MTKQPFLIPAVSFIVLSIPLIGGIIPRNRFYGIRTPKTLADDQSWFSANRLGGALIVGSSIIYLGTCVIAPYPSSDLSVHAAAFAGPLLISLLIIRRFLRRS